MEDFLQNVVKECGGGKTITSSSPIKATAQEAYDLLCSQNQLLRTPSYELRATCCKPIKLCIESKKSKLVALGLSGLAKMIRDERFQAGSEPEDDSLWLPSQLLYVTSSMLTQCDDIQVHILRCILSMACASSWALNGRLVMLLIGRCGEAYENGTQPVRAASQAAASQTLTAFCTFLDEECQEILQHQQKHKNSGSSAEMVYNKTSAVACFNEAIPVMQYICSKLEEMKTQPKSNDIIVFLLECLLTLVNTLPQTVHTNTHFTTFLWQRFCPALLALLGAPGDINTHQPGGLSTHQSKIVYSIGIQVVRLVGRERPLRPVLEALFHRMLLLPSPSKRLEPLKAAKELLRSPGRLADLLLLTGPIYRHAGDDMAIIRLIMDSIEESAQYSDVNVLLASVECVGALLGSLEALCKGEGLNQEGAEIANQRYVTLEQADYTGPLTYQSLARLPKPYRDVVANLKYQSDSDSSGIEGGAAEIHDGTDSDTSGATEGPEEYASQSDEAGGEDDSIMDDESFLTNQQLEKLHKIPKSLHLGRSGIDECNTDMERHNARHFVKTLQNILLPNLLTLRSSIQIDEVLQEFASKCCQHNSAQNYEIITIMNADGVYLATYSALLLNLKLIRSGHYLGTSASSALPHIVTMTESQFVDEIHGSGVLVYVSATWLCELYQNVLARSILELAGYDPKGMVQPALISLLIDVGGLCPTHQLTDWQKLARVHQGQPETSTETEAGIKLARRVLTCCWTSVVSVLGASLGEVPVCVAGSSTLSRLVERRSRQKHKQRLRDDVITASLEGLQKAASLSNTLQLQSRSSSILSLLSSSACSKAPQHQHSGAKIMAAHALSLDVLISKGLDLAAHSGACWPHVFAACVAVAGLEHALFSKTGAAQLLMVAQNAQNQVTSSTYGSGTTAAGGSGSVAGGSAACDGGATTGMGMGVANKMAFDGVAAGDEETVDVYSFLQTNTLYPHATTSLCPTPKFHSQSNSHCDTTTVAEIIERSGVLNHGRGLLHGVQAAKVCCVLSSKADELFHAAAVRLALPALCSFLTELCKASHAQLFNKDLLKPSAEDAIAKKPRWWRTRKYPGPNKLQAGTLLLNRIAEVTLKSIRSGRPLIHTMKVWSIVGPHLMQAACHKDRTITKKAIGAIHDVINLLLNENTELPHFHFNEALFKPFENLLTLELTDADVQDQIVASLCEFVEGNRTEIGSGWRPLFATLRVSSMGQTQNRLDVFYIFLQTDNTLVFANAALDYILCLLGHVKLNDATLSEECLKLLESCSSILGMMQLMPKCPTFNLTHRMSIETHHQVIDPHFVDATVVVKFTLGEQLCGSIGDEFSYKSLALDDVNKEAQITLTQMDAEQGRTGCLKVWYILLEGLAQIAPSHQQEDAKVLEAFIRLLRQLSPTSFGFYCLNHLLLPMLQLWLRRTCLIAETNQLKGSTQWRHFKQACGLSSDLVVEYIQASKTKVHSHQGVELALKQLLLFLIECVGQPIEQIARLGTSCIRHLILTLGHGLSGHQWEILATAIHRACVVTLNPLHQITLAFKPHSDSFYGDLATVKVAARQVGPTSKSDPEQVFLMQIQRTTGSATASVSADKSEDERAYVFLLYPYPLDQDVDRYTVRVPFQNVVVGILAHQILIQTISAALLQNLNHVTPILEILHINTDTGGSLRGILEHVNAKHVYILLKCLEVSSQRAKEFDLRPGLKFLTQKVGNLSKAANLYTQANTSEVVQMIVLIELCLDGIEKYSIPSGDIRNLLGKTCAENLFTDLDYVEEFLRDLRRKWEYLCESYTNLTLNLDEQDDVELLPVDQRSNEEIVKLRRRSVSVSSESSYLEKEVLPQIDPDPVAGTSTDDETNERAAAVKLIKYDTNTLLQMTLPHDHNQHKDIDISGVSTFNPRVNPFNEPVPVPVSIGQVQVVPTEIQQQRSLSIHKDFEAFKLTRIETMEACLELLGSLPSTRLAPLAMVLKDGAVMLVNSKEEKIKMAAEGLLRQMNIYE